MVDFGFYPLTWGEEPVQPVEEVPEGEKGIYLDTGPTLPKSYDLDLVRMLVQDPYRIYLFWELSGPGYRRTLRKAKLLGLREGKLALEITRLSDNTKTTLEVGDAREWWLLADPGTEYVAEIGVSFAGHFFTITRSNRVRTPSVTLADFERVPASSPVAGESRANEVLRASGYRLATVEEVREEIRREEREPTEGEQELIQHLPPSIRQVLVARREDLTPEILRRILWAVPRFVMLGSERVQIPERFLEEVLGWPRLGREWPSSATRL